MVKGDFITVVSGIPRSGTSMMMRMLIAGGIGGVCDLERQPDRYNPLGYYECEWVKYLGSRPEAIRSVRGMCVKVVSELIGFLPLGERYKVIFMLRDLRDVVSSQVSMAGRSFGVEHELLVDVFERHLLVVKDFIDSREDLCCLYVRFEDVLSEPRVSALKVRDFIGMDLDVDAMAGAIVEGLVVERDPNCQREVPCVKVVDKDVRESVLRSLGYL